MNNLWTTINSWLFYLNCRWINSSPSCIIFKVGETLISTQPFGDAVWLTTLSKKSDKTTWSLIWSPYRESIFISSGISWNSCKFFSLINIMTWLTMASKIFPRTNSSTFSCKVLLVSANNIKNKSQHYCIFICVI